MSDRPYQPRRSLIFMPGTRPDMFAKALATGADMVCIDMEDAIAPEHKDEARDKTLALFAERQADDGVERLVRINGLRTRDGIADLHALLASTTPPPALMLPKIKSAEDIEALDELLDGAHAHIRFHVIIETNEGLENCHEIAVASSRIDSLLFGAIDLSACLRVEPTWDALLYARSRVVHAAATASLDLIDVPYLDLDDSAGFEAAATAAANLGMTGKAAIHPKQIPLLNQTFTPSAEAIAHARTIIEAFDTADSGLVVVGGKLIERPVLRAMYRIVAIAERLGV